MIARATLLGEVQQELTFTGHANPDLHQFTITITQRRYRIERVLRQPIPEEAVPGEILVNECNWLERIKKSRPDYEEPDYGVDLLMPEEDLYVILLTQLLPSSTYPIRRELRQRVYQAIVD